MKLNVKNFTGNVNLNFRIRPETDKDSFTLFYEVRLDESWNCVNAVSAYFDHFKNEKECRKDVIERAEKRYGLELIKKEQLLQTA